MNKTARELLQGQQLVWVRPDDLVDTALQAMVKHDLTAVPVVEAGERSQVGAIKGFVDVVDLVAFLATIGTRPLTSPYGAGESRSLTTDDLGLLHRRSKEFRITNTVEVSDFCKRNPLHKVSATMTMKDLINFFGKSHEYVHRLAVVDDNHHLVGVITQSMLLSAIKDNLADRPEIKGTKVDSLNMTSIDKVAMVTTDTLAFDAFMKMHKECLSSLAIQSRTGEICENISATDLKGAITDFKLLTTPVGEYLRKTRNIVLGKKRSEGLVHCSLSHSLLDVINLVTLAHVHRTYVIDEQRKAIGVISLTDICRSLSRVLT